jgi:hypothetical protein
MATTKRSDMTDEEFGRRLVNCYDDIAQLHKDGGRDPDAVHPMKVINSWMGECREAREKANDDANTGLGPKYLQNKGDPDDPSGMGPREIQNKGKANDNPPEFAGKPANPTLGKPAVDGRYEIGSDGVPRFTDADGRFVVGDAALVARAGMGNPTRAAKLAARIQGYDRLK